MHLQNLFQLLAVSFRCCYGLLKHDILTVGESDGILVHAFPGIVCMYVAGKIRSKVKAGFAEVIYLSGVEEGVVKR